MKCIITQWEGKQICETKDHNGIINDKIKEENSETVGIFEPGMENLFDTASIVIDAILAGEL